MMLILQTGFLFTRNSPMMQNTSSTSNLIAIRSNAPGADKASRPVANVSTQNLSGPSSNIT